MDEALYLIDDQVYLHLKEVQNGFEYAVYDMETTERLGKSTILWIEMEDNPIKDPLACARSLAIEEAGLEGRSVESAPLALVEEIPLEERKILVLKVEPGGKPYAKMITDGYKSLQDEVNGLFQFIYPFDEQVAIVCNDEAKLIGMPLNRAMRNDNGEVYDIIAGSFLIVGIDGPDCSSLTQEQIKTYTNMYREPEVFVWNQGKILSYPAPDSTISMTEVRDLGYFQGNGFPLREERAKQLFEQGVTVYMLNICNPEAKIPVSSLEDLIEHAEDAGIFAVSVRDWVRIVDNGLEGKTSVRDKLREKGKEASQNAPKAPKKEKGAEIE